MSVTRLKKGAIRKAGKVYGENSPEHKAAELIVDSKVQLESLGALVGIRPEQIEMDIEGTLRLDEKTHNLYIRATTAILQFGFDREVFPCGDPKHADNYVRLILEVLRAEQQLKAVQAQPKSE